MTKLPTAPLPRLDDVVLMRHGAGGRAMRTLINRIFARDLTPSTDTMVGLDAFDDGAAFRIGDQWLVMTTDSHVIKPVEFPGGDIGRLSVSGTVNDLAMMGATEPLGITCAVVLEEGFPVDVLTRIHDSMLAAAREAGVPIVTGDTKVMGRGEIDGIILNTTGIGLTSQLVRDRGLSAGDRIIITGTIGDHGMAIMAARHNLELTGALASDVAPINHMIRAAMATGGEGIVAMKDPTRGGVASALHEMAEKARVGIVLDEASLPIRAQVAAAADLIGIDPLVVANEGKAVIGVRADVADAVLAALRAHPLGCDAAIVGTAIADYPGTVILDTGFGRRLVAEPEGELLPRIC